MKTSCFSILLFCVAHHTAARYLRSQAAIDVAQNPVELVASTLVDDINDGDSPFSNILVLNEYQSAQGDISLEDIEDVTDTLLDDTVVKDSHDFSVEAGVAKPEEDVGEIDDLVDPTLISLVEVVPVAGGEGDLDALLDEIHDISDDQIYEDSLIDLEDKLHEAIEDREDAIDEEHGSFERDGLLQSSPSALDEQAVASASDDLGDELIDGEELLDDLQDTLDEVDGDVQVDPIVEIDERAAASASEDLSEDLSDELVDGEELLGDLQDTLDEVDGDVQVDPIVEIDERAAASASEDFSDELIDGEELLDDLEDTLDEVDGDIQVDPIVEIDERAAASASDDLGDELVDGEELLDDLEDTLDEVDGDIQGDPIDDDVEVDPIVDDDIQVDPIVEIDEQVVASASEDLSGELIDGEELLDDLEDTLDEVDGDIQVDPIDDEVEIDPIVDVVEGPVSAIAQESGDDQVDPIDDIEDLQVDPIVDDLVDVVDEDNLPDDLPDGLLSSEQAN